MDRVEMHKVRQGLVKGARNGFSHAAEAKYAEYRNLKIGGRCKCG